MILLWGAPGDDPLDAISAELVKRGAAMTLLDQRSVLDHRVELTIGDSMPLATVGRSIGRGG